MPSAFCTVVFSVTFAFRTFGRLAMTDWSSGVVASAVIAAFQAAVVLVPELLLVEPRVVAANPVLLKPTLKLRVTSSRKTDCQ